MWRPGRTRTCNQTVMSGRIKDAIVDFPAFLSMIDCVGCVLFKSFLVRNWCGTIVVGRVHGSGGELLASVLLCSNFTRRLVGPATKCPPEIRCIAKAQRKSDIFGH